MRNQWRFLLRYNQSHTYISQSNISRNLSHFQVTSNPTFLPQSTPFTPSFTPHFNPFFLHHFSTISENSTDPFALINIFAKPINGDEIGKELSDIHAVLTPVVVTDVLKNLNDDPKTAVKFFDWVSERENESLSCKGYNFMLGVLGSNGLFKEFWNLYDVMVKMGFGVRKGTYEKVLDKFEKEGSQFDVEKLKNLYSKDVKKIGSESARVSDLVEGKVWDKSVEEEVKGLGVSYTSELVKLLLEKFEDVPIKKGLRFFRWVEESGLFKHDQGTYNAMAVVLSGGNNFTRFWNLLDDMRNVGFELEMETYRQVSKRFVEKNSVEDAVRLYEYAMDGANKPSREDFIYLAKEVVVSKELGLQLFSRVVKKFSESDLFEHDQRTYNAMAVALGRLDDFDKLFNLVDDMRNLGFELDMETYRQICKRFIMNKKVEDTVKLYEYAMNGPNKPSREDFILLVKEVNVAKELGIELYSRVVKKFSESGLFEHDQGTYNAMAVALGRLNCFDKFWNLVDEMRNAGFELEMETFRWVSVRFFKNKMVEDADRLYEYAMNGANKPSREDFIYLVKMVVVAKELGVEFFSRVVNKFSEHGLFEHDQETYNAMAVTLGRLESFDRFWNLVDEMRNAGFALQMETYRKISKRFIENMMVEDAVRLYEYAMNEANKPSLKDCIRLLEKVVAAEDFDTELFSRVVKIYLEYNNALDDSMLDSLHKSLTSAGRMDVYFKVIDAMAECGYKPSELMLCRVASDVSSTGTKDEAGEFIDKTREHFEMILKREGSSSSTVDAVDLLVNAYCNTERVDEACRIVNQLVDKEDIKLGYDTYKTLISKLLTQNGFQEALNLIGLMRKHEYRLFLDPFIAYLANEGTTDEAMTFFKAIAVKTFPSTNVVLRLFEAYLATGKHGEAHNVLARCPQYIRNNAGVLNLFYSLKPETEPVAVAAA